MCPHRSQVSALSKRACDTRERKVIAIHKSSPVPVKGEDAIGRRDNRRFPCCADTHVCAETDPKESGGTQGRRQDVYI